MKKAFFFSLMLLITPFSYLMAQQTQEELNQYNKERLTIQKKGMAVLGAWAIGNIATGVIGYKSNEGSVANFYKMNIIWNGINLALAVPGYIGASNGKYNLSLRRSYKEQLALEKSFIFNTGLDVAYVMGGLYLIEKSKTETSLSKRNENLGYGNSILFQGGFLMLFDAAMYAIHTSHGNKKLPDYLDKITIGYNSVGFRHQF
ncbi:MAG TPA: hypothetical protein VK766_03040 [Cytophagaceae bacterium]|jgi:hypothetical protein|nr:hypothetical protein [Cytophagaceae bacterium]